MIYFYLIVDLICYFDVNYNCVDDRFYNLIYFYKLLLIYFVLLTSNVLL